MASGVVLCLGVVPPGWSIRRSCGSPRLWRAAGFVTLIVWSPRCRTGGWTPLIPSGSLRPSGIVLDLPGVDPNAACSGPSGSSPARAIALCAVVVWPGVVRQGNLDARAVNVLPAWGVALALALSLLAGPAAWRRDAPGDRARLVLAALLAFLALPWLAAELGSS